MLADLAVELGVPLIAAWYNTSVPRAFGYQGMNSLNAVTMQAMPHRHPCNITSDQGESGKREEGREAREKRRGE